MLTCAVTIWLHRAKLYSSLATFIHMEYGHICSKGGNAIVKTTLVRD